MSRDGLASSRLTPTLSLVAEGDPDAGRAAEALSDRKDLPHHAGVYLARPGIDGDTRGLARPQVGKLALGSDCLQEERVAGDQVHQPGAQRDILALVHQLLRDRAGDRRDDAGLADQLAVVGDVTAELIHGRGRAAYVLLAETGLDEAGARGARDGLGLTDGFARGRHFILAHLSLGAVRFRILQRLLGLRHLLLGHLDLFGPRALLGETALLLGVGELHLRQLIGPLRVVRLLLRDRAFLEELLAAVITAAGGSPGQPRGPPPPPGPADLPPA